MTANDQLVSDLRLPGDCLNIRRMAADRIEALEAELSFANDCLKASGYLAGGTA